MKYIFAIALLVLSAQAVMKNGPKPPKVPQEIIEGLEDLHDWLEEYANTYEAIV